MIDNKKIQKLYLETYRKLYYHTKLNSNKVNYYVGQMNLIENNFSEYLGTENDIVNIKQLAESQAQSDLEVYGL